MEAHVIKINSNKVQVYTRFGCVWGEWCSPVPADLKKYILEIDSDDIITFDNIRLSKYLEPQMKYDNGNVCLNGTVDEIEDGVMILRLSNAIVMLQIQNDRDFSIFVNKFVCVTLKNIQFYDTGIY